MTEAERLMAHINDKMRLCERSYMITNTRFLSLGERAAAKREIEREYPNHIFWGGFPDAERTVLFFLPDYMEKEAFPQSPEDLPFCLAVCRTAGGRSLTHRDYLGSLMALGLERDVIGDILVRDDGADIIVMNTIADYLLANYEKAGTVGIKMEIRPIEALVLPEKKTEWKRESVASLRLDNMLCAAFGVSRADAVSAISHKLCFVNDAEAEKPDMRIHEGDKLVLRGKGKAYFRKEDGTTRKGRISAIFEIYQ